MAECYLLINRKKSTFPNLQIWKIGAASAWNGEISSDKNQLNFMTSRRGLISGGNFNLFAWTHILYIWSWTLQNTWNIYKGKYFCFQNKSILRSKTVGQSDPRGFVSFSKTFFGAKLGEELARPHYGTRPAGSQSCQLVGGNIKLENWRKPEGW